MTSLEKIVRPFQTNNIRPNFPRVGPPSLPADTIVIEIGKEGSIQKLNGSYSASGTSYTEGTSSEFERTVQEVRIENPDDPTQHVDVDVVTGLKVVQTTEEGQTRELSTKLAPIPAGSIVNGNERVIKTEVAARTAGQQRQFDRDGF